MGNPAITVALVVGLFALILIVFHAYRMDRIEERLGERIDKLSDLTNDALMDLLSGAGSNIFGFSSVVATEIIGRIRAARRERKQCGSCGHAAFHHSIGDGCTISVCQCANRRPLWQGDEGDE